MSVLTHLLPDSTNLRLENCQLDEIKTQINLIVSAISKVVNCPVCNPRQRPDGGTSMSKFGLQQID
ncbi:hypothetical protein CDG79_25900 [Nostoc sp. 'Peltigera membranacea cyanobiont' 232]|nr:hypothetical protein CDG79_25900 [Nostoc sp. 'Peltigera membranacea cyanobiont' 232]